MGASNTPLYDLIEISGLTVNTTYTTAPGGGGDIIRFVDNATYTDGEHDNTQSFIGELNETPDADSGTLRIDGVTYNIQLADPDNTNVTFTYNWGASTRNLTGSSGTTDVAFIMATPQGGGATRYFIAVDDGVGNMPNITSIQIRSIDFDPAGDDLQITLSQNNNITVCFTAGTLIETAAGPRAVETVAAGDLVLTLDHGFRPVRWVGYHVYPLDNRMRAKRNAPVRVNRGALGPGIPARDLLLSPQHRVMLASPIARRIFDSREVLVPVKKLVGLPGVIRERQMDRVTYCHLLFDAHEILWAEGAPAESLLPDKEALRGLSASAGEDIAALGRGPMLPARPILENRREIEELLRRHRKNVKPLVDPALVTRRSVMAGKPMLRVAVS
ncbi:Hint domain-containing protein [uncultured Maritimibacter sp.]|jgi:hypothetical protein|uniref:Hint domain-containing protein n=1 Tax=uncultured Maritimibacter sp. TaxID=991866 RepID=UPI000A5C3EE2|nr:Hint domain-containing protein [uncultured Maritimibacter sp.]